MTEEVLDDWEAQTLNIPFEKLVRHKKTLKNVIVINSIINQLEELERQRNSVKIKPILVQAQPTNKKSKSMQPGKRNKQAKTVAQPAQAAVGSSDKSQSMLLKRQQQQIKNFTASIMKGNN